MFLMDEFTRSQTMDAANRKRRVSEALTEATLRLDAPTYVGNDADLALWAKARGYPVVPMTFGDPTDEHPAVRYLGDPHYG